MTPDNQPPEPSREAVQAAKAWVDDSQTYAGFILLRSANPGSGSV
jgi:hypothetical protein